ncbi:MAG TPA: hypothetical protein VMW30_00510 [Candidatus Paceibacterota bacterium]|nr:hypothetical protein [Candidatus Paceibacterota bacterium]
MVLISIALLLVTAIYAWLTFAIAKETRKAAEASRDSAESARTAAEASLRSALVAEAQMNVDFEIKINRHTNGAVWFNLVSSVNVWVRAVAVEIGVLVTQDGPGRACRADLQFADAHDSFPKYVHAGQGFSLEWLEPEYGIGDYGILGTASIAYSLNEGGEVRRREVYFQSRKGIGRDALLRFGMLQNDDIDRIRNITTDES